MAGDNRSMAVFAGLNRIENLTLNAGYIYNATDTDFITKTAKNALSLSAAYDFKETGLLIAADVISAISNEYLDKGETKKYEKNGTSLIPFLAKGCITYKAMKNITVGLECKVAMMIGDSDSTNSEVYPKFTYSLDNKMGSVTTGVRMNVDKDGLYKIAIPLRKIKYRTIAEQLRDQKKWKIGVISTVNLNHATPAATYAHQASRKSNYPIGLELVDSNFDYFAGGALMESQDKNKDKTSIYDLAKNAGYTVCFDQKSAASLKNGDKALVVAETLADSDSMNYDNDRKNGEWALRDYVRKGIEVLDNKTGFFMMVEGGKVDWACHANDARSSIADTLALSQAVEEAIDFYNKHPKETLIIVTADHETGGLTIGYAGTDYNLFFRTLDGQKISYAKYDSDYVSAYKKNGTSFDDVMKDVEALFGLKLPGSKGSNKNGGLVLTDYELGRIKTAYEKTIKNDKNRNQQEYDLYGTYEPLTITITHVLNAKSGLGWTSNSHTGLPVPVFALGAGQEEFKGFYDNTEIYRKVAQLTKVVKD
ncbi:MAG: alkaline phosphatase [Treponema sp.]|nr:alkaline phosphatase [Candidatus Treponema equifaecale]